MSLQDTSAGGRLITSRSAGREPLPGCECAGWLGVQVQEQKAARLDALSGIRH